MLDKLKQPQRAIQVSGNVPIYHRYTLGVAGERFFKALRDQQQILASPCPQCHDRLLPPKMYCERCFEATSEDWASLEAPVTSAASQSCIDHWKRSRWRRPR